MKRRGFTLVETVIALVILGIVSMSVVSLTATASIMMAKNKRDQDMIAIAGSVIENIRAYSPESKRDLFVIDKNVKDIIQTFNRDLNSSIDFSSKSEYQDEYNINISKEDRSESLWKICVTVSYDKGEVRDEIKYKTIIPKK